MRRRDGITKDDGQMAGQRESMGERSPERKEEEGAYHLLSMFVFRFGENSSLMETPFSDFQRDTFIIICGCSWSFVVTRDYL